MQLKNDTTRYGAIAMLFHWAIVGLIITQFFLANKADGLPLGPAKIATLATHKSFGMTIFGLAVLRLIWRWFNPMPPEPANEPSWQRAATKVSHWALYALIAITPLFGWFMSSARYAFFHGAHEVLAWTLFVVALVHAAAALRHHVFDRAVANEVKIRFSLLLKQ